MPYNVLRVLGLSSILLLGACSSTDSDESGDKKVEEVSEQADKEQGESKKISERGLAVNAFEYSLYDFDVDDLIGDYEKDDEVDAELKAMGLVTATNGGTTEELMTNFNALKKEFAFNHLLFYIYMVDREFDKDLILDFIYGENVDWVETFIDFYVNIALKNPDEFDTSEDVINFSLSMLDFKEEHYDYVNEQINKHR